MSRRADSLLMWSLGNTNGSNFELFALLGEAYGSGLPLGYLLVRSPGSTEGGEKQAILEQFLKHMVTKYNLRISTTLSDKDWSEINACRSTCNLSNHQLCYWHCLRAVKKRLATLRRQPAFYDVEEARQEFPWIDETFLPMKQRTDGKASTI